MAGSEKVDTVGQQVQELMLAEGSGVSSYLLIATGVKDGKGESAVHCSWGVPEDCSAEFYQELAQSYLEHAQKMLSQVAEVTSNTAEKRHYDA